MRLRKRWYVGLQSDGQRIAFAQVEEPTQATHGAVYNAVIGPFRTMRGANFMALYGQGNPHCRTVADAERLAKKYALPSGRMRGEDRSL